MVFEERAVLCKCVVGAALDGSSILVGYTDRRPQQRLERRHFIVAGQHSHAATKSGKLLRARRRKHGTAQVSFCDRMSPLRDCVQEAVLSSMSLARLLDLAFCKQGVASNSRH